MKRKSLIYINFISLIVVTFVVSTASAKVVSQADALQVATSFFNSKVVNSLSSNLQLKEIWNSNNLSQEGISLLDNNDPTFFVFAPETGSGFVIVSGDDIMSPILAYSFEDSAPDGDLPCNLQWWCEAMHSQISQMREEGATSNAKGIQVLADNNYGQDVVLYETAKWNQLSPFNQQCPIIGSSHCATGCVSTAISIIMKYHKWPESGVGETEEYTTSSGLFVESRNLEHVYEWGNMLNNYSNGYSDAQASAVATLMADIGCLFQASYGNGLMGTSTSVGMAEYAKLYKHFDYSPKMIEEKGALYSEEEWCQLLKNELLTNGPILFSGSSGTSGHAFVLDGCTTNDYFHINWGWGGSSNGYFLLPEIEYNQSQDALLNLIPDDGSEPFMVIRIYQEGIYVDSDVITPNKIFYVDGLKIANCAAIPFSGKVCFALTDAEGNRKEWISTEIAFSLDVGYYLSFYAIDCIINGEIKAGDRIRLFYQSDSSDIWNLVTPYDKDCTWEIVLNADSSISGIESVSSDDIEGVGYYTIDGKSVENPQKGINIVKYSDGTTKKVMMK